MLRLSRREAFAGSREELREKISRKSGGFRKLIEFLAKPHLAPGAKCPSRERLVKIGTGRESPTKDELDHFKMGCPLECGAYVGRLTGSQRNLEIGASA